MSDKMKPLTISQLLNWILIEYHKYNSIFGISKENFYFHTSKNNLKIFGRGIDSQLGPAAGPHTQLAQNIIASYLTGGRFIELKTVQILDELEIKKPCIDAGDECYNIEWSQELLLDQSYEEYVKAWVLIHVIKKLFKLSDSAESGFIFNMSVGYNLEGIKSKKINSFIENMIDADKSQIFNKLIDQVKKILSDNYLSKVIKELNPDLIDIDGLLKSIPYNISDSMTLSTMHGCPPSEIEAIIKYLLEEKKLNTFVKLNPTLLGYDFINNVLTSLGYTYLSVPEIVFEKDMKMDAAIPMINRLQQCAESNNLNFGVKLSNTLPVDNSRPNLNEDEMYMSGRSLFPITINLALKLSTEFNGKLNISYSGGACSHNIKELAECGFFPITIATDLLKPGGYGRLKQMNNILTDIPLAGKVDIEKLKKLALMSFEDPEYKKDKRQIGSIKIPKYLPLFDCYIAPCREACPIGQDVPEYISLVKQERYKEALEIITARNPLPHITGYICDHQCMEHCTRWDYDNPVLIRDIKKEAAIKGFDEFINSYNFPENKNKVSSPVAIIGAGPAGLAAAYFLSRKGFEVTVFEKENNAGGIVRNVIPLFRLPAEAIDKDIKFIEKHGVRFVFGFDYNFSLTDLKKEGFQYILIAIGAGLSNRMELNDWNDNVIDAIDFLWEYHHRNTYELGKNVAVIGGGNSAMDGARAAKKCEEVENVYLIYRRTKEFMPADMEEFYAALEDGVVYKELLQPISFSEGLLKCQKMILGELDTDGRRKAIPVENNFVEIKVDTVISAIGEHADFNLLESNKIRVENNKTFVNNSNYETNIKNVFVCGDASKGPDTVVQAIADARKVTDEILSRENMLLPETVDFISEIENLNVKKSFVKNSLPTNLIEEADRCLMCSYECDKCIDVCPNRANVAVKISSNGFKDSHQIVHIDGLCNECGNCSTFCPYQGNPYKEKFTYFTNEIDFQESNNPGFVKITSPDGGKSYKIRLDGKIISLNSINQINLEEVPKDCVKVIEEIEKGYSFLML